MFFCIDASYLMPALVSLVSLATSNPLLAQSSVASFVVDGTIIDTARPWLRQIATSLGLTVELIAASQVVPSNAALRTGYGLMTGGRSLSTAAYYRIFYAKHLASMGRFREALYIDADTIVRPGLRDLFDIDMTQPLMARLDQDRAEVRRAVQLHGLSKGYFNSGVLRFDLRHKDLPRLLDRAIADANDPSVPLIYHDQCALNRAFDGRVDVLPARFNAMLRSDTSADGLAPSEAVIVHYLDRPKPWDSMYRPAANEWFDWLGRVVALGHGLEPLQLG
jgi:lipopolysaccharide biosynthesis glycosyltransferase